MKTFKEYIANGNEINEANKEFDNIVDMISDDWHKRVYIVKFLGERNGLKLFEVRNHFSDKVLYSYDGKKLARITTVSKLIELLIGGKPEIIYHG